MESAARSLTDNELLDRLKHQGAMWLNNENLLLLEELFRRYTKCKNSRTAGGTSSN